MAIAACCHQVDCAFFLMEWHCGQVSAPGSMQFAAHHLQVDCAFLVRQQEDTTTMAIAYCAASGVK